MTNTTQTAAVAAMALLLAATGSTSAASIKDQLTDRQISTFCANQPVGSQVRAGATLAGGVFVSGTVQCEAGDVAAVQSNVSQNQVSPEGQNNSWSSDDEYGDDHGSDDDHGGRDTNDDDSNED